MDLKDNKLLLELDKDSRASLTQLGKRTGMKQETVRYRLKRLEKKGVIQQFLGIVNGAALGYTYCQLFIKLQDLKKTTREETLEYLKRNNQVSWIGNLIGAYDIAIIIRMKKNADLKEFMDEFRTVVGKNVFKKTISIHMNSTFYNRDYLVDNERKIVSEQKTIHYETQVIDRLDNEICKLYCENSRMSAVEMAAKLNISSDAILLRLKKLKKNTIIQGGTTVLHLPALGLQHHKILLYFKNADKQRRMELLQLAQSHNRVIAIVNTLSEWDMEIDMEVENTTQLHEFIGKLTAAFPEVIRDYFTVHITEMPKYSFL